MLKKILMTAAMPVIPVLFTQAIYAEAHSGAPMMTGYALADDGASVVVMPDLSDPATAMSEELDNAVAAIAYRPVTGDLLGFGDGMIYTIDPMTGMTTDLGASFMDDAMIDEAAMIGFDFNNAIDAVRAVSTEGDNLVYFPEGFGDDDERANSVRRFTSLAYEDGDANAGTTPMIFANAYTNAINGMTASETFQYALDAETDSLVSLANNAGTLATIAEVTVDGMAADLAPMGGFDIASPAEGENMGYAILQMEGAETAGLYSIDLESGAAEMLADLGMGGVSGFAVAVAAE